jgi:hypothetical protein
MASKTSKERAGYELRSLHLDSFLKIVTVSVADPDPYVFWLPGTGSFSKVY